MYVCMEKSQKYLSVTITIYKPDLFINSPVLFELRHEKTCFSLMQYMKTKAEISCAVKKVFAT